MFSQGPRSERVSGVTGFTTLDPLFLRIEIPVNQFIDRDVIRVMLGNPQSFTRQPVEIILLRGLGFIPSAKRDVFAVDLLAP